MANWFERVTKTLADDKLSRRKAIQKAAGAAAGMALAAFIPGEAFAASPNFCRPPGSCSIGFTQCSTNPNCFCFDQLNGSGSCGCNVFCNRVRMCGASSHCPRGSFCAFFTGCDCDGEFGVCVPHCTRTCTFDEVHIGANAANR
jgi:hypothetical protein